MKNLNTMGFYAPFDKVRALKLAVVADSPADLALDQMLSAELSWLGDAKEEDDLLPFQRNDCWDLLEMALTTHLASNAKRSDEFWAKEVWAWGHPEELAALVTRLTWNAALVTCLRMSFQIVSSRMLCGS